MKIDPLKPNVYQMNQGAPKESSKAADQSAKPGDSLNISAEALQLNKALAEEKKLDVIREKIQSNFYDSPEVLNKVADKILQELTAKNK